MSEGMDFLVGEENGAVAVAEPKGAAIPVGPKGPTGNAARVMNRLASELSPAAHRDEDEAARDVLGEIADFLSPPAEDTPAPRDERGRFAKSKAAETEAESEIDDGEEPAKPANFHRHDPRLIHLASANGIGPDEAAQYPTARALLAEVRLRELERGRFQPAGQQQQQQQRAQTGQRGQQQTDDDLTAPTLDFDEEIDPKLRSTVEKVSTYAQKVKEYADRKIAQLEQENLQLREEHEQAATRQTRQTEAKIAQMFNEKVASWGEDFQTILGVPNESFQRPGTKQHAEARKLYNYVLRNKLGYEAMTGQEATIDDVSAWIDEAKFALWPDAAERAARTKVATNLRKQRGGVGLRPSRSSREIEPPAQGDDAAKASIVEYMGAQGFDPWMYGRKRSA